MPVYSSLFRLTFLLLAASLISGPAAAQDIYIKPNTDNTGSMSPPTVDLGLKSRPKPAKSAKPEALPIPPIPTGPAPTTPAPQPSPTPQPVPTTPTPTVPTPTPGGGATVYSVPPDPAPDPGTGPHTFTINFAPGGLGPGDKTTVMQSLGLSEAELQKVCTFRYSTMLTYSTAGGVFLASGVSNSLSYRFTAPMTAVQIYPSIACQKLRRPVSGMVLEQGDFYSISLSAVDCAPGAKGNATSVLLSFRYTGDGTGECRYQ